ncbi:hypothetical protein [uncultured Jatrophihabitans sp.]|uniref:hypothetical protein n=1 Tax=uncultured Jatrophihabitans sp. TaxID=1610747 RepID=UPI0035C9A29C
MTARVGSTSIDGSPISDNDLARIQAEEQLHAQQQRSAARIIAAASTDVEDARALLSMLGLGADVVSAARAELGTPAKLPGKRSAAA